MNRIGLVIGIGAAFLFVCICAPVIIFGAGRLGVQLVAALRRSYDRDPVAFIDTDDSMWRQYVSGVISSPETKE